MVDESLVSVSLSVWVALGSRRVGEVQEAYSSAVRGYYMLL